MQLPWIASALLYQKLLICRKLNPRPCQVVLGISKMLLIICFSTISFLLHNVYRTYIIDVVRYTPDLYKS